MIPVRSRWGHIYPFFFQEKNTAAPQQHSTMPRLPKISNCNSASKAGTLEICDKTSKVTQVLILWGLWRNPRKIAEYSTLNQLFYDFIFFLLNLLHELFSDFLMYSPNSLNARLLWRCPQAAEGVPRPSLRSRTIGQHPDFVPVKPTIGMITPTWFKSIESQKLPKTFTVSHSGVALGCSVLGNAVPSSKSNKHVWEYPNLWELQHHGYTSINLIPTAPPNTVRAWHPKFDTPKLSE